MISPTKKKRDDKCTEIYGLSPVKKIEPALTTLSDIFFAYKTLTPAGMQVCGVTLDEAMF